MSVDLEQLTKAADSEAWVAAAVADLPDEMAVFHVLNAVDVLLESPHGWFCQKWGPSVGEGVWEDGACSVCNKVGAGCHPVLLVPVEPAKGEAA